MMIKQLMQRAVAVLAVTTALATGAVSAQAADAAVFGDNAGTVSTGVHLSLGQFQALQAAAAHNPALTGAQARQILANSAAGAGASGIHPNGWGSGSSKGPCGTAVLQGDTYGRWNFSLSFNVSQVGTASVGGVSVSTNAAYGAGSKGFGVSGGYVYHDSLRDGVLGSIGWGATGDTLSGWALTNGAWFCEIDVTAIWH